MEIFLKYSLSLRYTLPFLIGLTIRLEDSVTVMATGICTKIFFDHAVKYTKKLDLMQIKHIGKLYMPIMKKLLTVIGNKDIINTIL